MLKGIINSMTPFTLTESAKEQMTYLLSKNPGKDAVHLQVKGGGCAGFEYEWTFEDNDTLNDVVVDDILFSSSAVLIIDRQRIIIKIYIAKTAMKNSLHG